MCGIVGFTGTLPGKKEIIKKMTDRIVHRGPDMTGVYVSPDEDVAFGFRRLNIIDLRSKANQPMCSYPDGKYVIVFNGEIYNYRDIRTDLEKRGMVFHTETDTEVLLNGYIFYHEKILNMLRGMFAFVIYDREKNILFGARDFFGIKPLYYSMLDNGGFIFGSEIKSFLECPQFHKKLNDKLLRSYLTSQYNAAEETFFEGVYKFPPAHYFIYSLSNNSFKITRYWEIHYEFGNRSFEECASHIDELFRESVLIHSQADVKVGAFLSGGVDSSYLVAVMRPDETFTVGFDNRGMFDERDKAEQLAEFLGIKNRRKLITSEQCMNALSDIQYHMDEPDSNPSCLPLYFLSNFASEYVTVVLSGEGADEVYAGSIEQYMDSSIARYYKKLFPKNFRKVMANAVSKLPYFKGKNLIMRSGKKVSDYFTGHAYIFSNEESGELLTEQFQEGIKLIDMCSSYFESVSNMDDLTQKCFLDFHKWLPNTILAKADKLSMASSLELRVPFLDKKIMEDSQTIPSEYKIRKLGKDVLREASRTVLPDEWAYRPKNGFPTPIKEWFREDRYSSMLADYFSSNFTKEFFDRDILFRILEKHKSGKANLQRKLYTVLTFLVWYERFFIKEH